jgi:hypothetical protein
MSNTNGSMDYRGFLISGGTDTSGNPEPPFILPDPFDTINVETLNIVDNQNQAFYTMPKEQNLIGGDGAVAVFNADGGSSLQSHTQPAYMYFQSNPGQFISPSENTILLLPEGRVRTQYNINLNSVSSFFTMPPGAYLVNFNCQYKSDNPTNPTGMYVSVNGALISLGDAPFKYFLNTPAFIPIAWSQIININSITDTVQIIVDNRINTGFLNISEIGINITKVAPNFQTNVLPFYGEFYAEQTYIADNKIVDLTNKQKVKTEIPYNLIDRELVTNVNARVIRDEDNEFNILELTGTSQIPVYTLQFAGNLGFTCFKNEFLRITAVFQHSVNGFNWYNIDNEITIYTNGSQLNDTDVSPIPVSLIKYGYTPLQNTSRSYIRVLIIVYPNDFAGVFANNSQLYFNNALLRGKTNCMMSIFELGGTLGTRYNMATNGNGQYLIQNNTYGLPAPSQYTINGQNAPFFNSRFTLFPLVINNKLIDAFSSFGNSRVRIEYPTNNLGNLHGPTFCWLRSEIDVSISLKIDLDITFGNSGLDTVTLIEYHGNSPFRQLGSYNLTGAVFSLVASIDVVTNLDKDNPTYFAFLWNGFFNNTMQIAYRANNKIEIIESP